MSSFDGNKPYRPVKIPRRATEPEAGDAPQAPQTERHLHTEKGQEVFYEISYDLGPIPGVGKFVRKSQKIEPPEKDETRERFQQMRQLARENRLFSFIKTRFFDQNVRRENAKIFYNQGVFMKDFTDQYTESVPYSSYFPTYQMMGYEQLRTYFTWRTEVRKGNVTKTSLSYAFLYIYELLCNIGVESSQEGLTRLMSFWNAFRAYEPTIDRYLFQWLKDYHIYYALPHSFREFVERNGLTAHYPNLADAKGDFAFYCPLSKYNIRKSAFYLDNQEALVADCFSHVIKKLKQVFEEHGIPFEESIFHSTGKMSVWHPFEGAVFHPWRNQADRQVVISQKELYLCRQNRWTRSTVITTDSGRQLIGYIMKQMEAELRKATNYKYKLKPKMDTVQHEAIGKLTKAGLSLEQIIRCAVQEFYREATKIVVQVNHSALIRIRQEALNTQEKLTVPEQYEEEVTVPALKETAAESRAAQEGPAYSPNNSWESLHNALSVTELRALSILMDPRQDIKEFADRQGVMLEVLIDGINEKAMDFIGDNLTDDAFVLYDDYHNEIRELVKDNDK